MIFLLNSDTPDHRLYNFCTCEQLHQSQQTDLVSGHSRLMPSVCGEEVWFAPRNERCKVMCQKSYLGHSVSHVFRIFYLCDSVINRFGSD